VKDNLDIMGNLHCMKLSSLSGPQSK